MALYEPGAAFVAEPGKVVTGLEAIREVIGAVIATKPQIDIEVEQVIQSGDVALLHARYTLKGTGLDGKPTEMSGAAAPRSCVGRPTVAGASSSTTPLGPANLAAWANRLRRD